MITVQDLRVDNWVQVEKTFGVFQVTNILYNGATVTDQDYEDTEIIDYNLLEGIPISREWLLNFGFKHLNSDDWFTIKLRNIEISIEITNHDISVTTNRGQVIFDTHIKYFHELQNLYYALTGQELTLN